MSTDIEIYMYDAKGMAKTAMSLFCIQNQFRKPRIKR